MGDQKTQQALEHVSKSHEKHVAEPTPSIEPAGPNDKQILSRLGRAGSLPSVPGQGLSHPTAAAYQATMLRTLQHRQGNAFVQRAVAQGRSTAGVSESAVGQAESDQSSGQSLDSSVQADMEPRFGQDFSGVRIHTDEKAAELAQGIQAQAFTRGQDIYFGAERYQPDTKQGRHLLAHELTHTIQQGQMRPPTAQATQTSRGVSQPGDPLESEAETIANRVAIGQDASVSTISSASPNQGVIARQPLVPSPTTTAIPGGSPTSSVQTQSITMEYSLNIEKQHTGELEIITAPRLVHERHIHIKTESGAEADVTIKGTTELPASVDPDIDSNVALRVPGEAEIEYTLFGTLADGTPVTSIGLFKGDNTSLARLADTGPDFIHFGLTAGQQYQTIVDAMQHSVTEQVWKDAEKKGRERQKQQQVQYPSQEEFEKMTSEEKRSLADHKFREEFSWGNVLKGVLLGVLAVALGIVAIVATSPAIVIGALLASLALAIWGLSQVISSTIHDVGERWEQGDIPGALLELLKGVALAAGIILGAIVLVIAVVTGVVPVALAIAAIVAFVVAAIIGIILVFRDLDKAGQAQNVEDFKQHVKKAAREAEEAITNIIVLIVSFILGAIGKMLKGGRQSDSGPPGGELPPTQERQGPVLEGGEIAIEPGRNSGTVQETVLANGRSGITLTDVVGESVTAEVISRTNVGQGRVVRVRLPNGREGDVFVTTDDQGATRWRALSPEESAALGRGDAIRGSRSAPAAPLDPPQLPNGDIDFASWQLRLQAEGIRGDVATKIAEAQAGDTDSLAELKAAERAALAGYDVEIVRPPKTQEQPKGGRNPDLRITRDGRAVRLEVKSRGTDKAGNKRPITKNSLNDDIKDAADQLSRSPEGKGDIIVDATDAAPGGLTQAQIENILKGKLTGNRFNPASMLKDVEYLEVIYNEGGQVKRSYIFRDANGDASRVFTEVFE